MTCPTYTVMMEIAGDTAMWTRPDTGDCPVSLVAPTYSAVKAIFESVLLGFKSLVTPTKVEICAPLQYHSYHTNYGGPLRQTKSITEGNSYQSLATVLIDVCYRLYAEVSIAHGAYSVSEKTKQWDKKTTSPAHAYQDIFNRRLKRGQCYTVPFLGWKEFTPSYFGVFRESTQVQSDITQRIPSMLREVFPGGYNSPPFYTYDQDVLISQGVLSFAAKDGEHDQ